MRIACDVQGTIEGYKKEFVLRLIRKLMNHGVELTVWSNSYGYALDAVKDYDLQCFAISKKTISDFDFDQTKFFDLAIEDDTHQDFLSSKRFLWVHDIPIQDSDIDQLAENISKGLWENAPCKPSRWITRFT